MLLTMELGQTIIKRVTEYVDVDINIMNLDGKIVASTDENRIREIHPGAIEVIRTGDSITIRKENIVQYAGAKEGVNLPIFHRGKITGVVGVSGKAKDVLPITGLVRASVEIVLEQIYFQRQIYNEEKQWNYWLHQLLHPSGFNRAALEEEANYSLKINIHLHWQVVLLTGQLRAEDLSAMKGSLLEMDLHHFVLVEFSEKETLIIVANAEESIIKIAKDMSKQIPDGVRITVGEAYFGIEGIRRSYFEAKQILFFSDESQILYSRDFRRVRLISTVNKKEYDHICLRYEHKLDQLGEEYRATLETYFGFDFSIKKTAAALHIHRNTLLYRLEQVKRKVGLDPRSFQDAFLLHIIQLYRQ